MVRKANPPTALCTVLVSFFLVSSGAPLRAQALPTAACVGDCSGDGAVTVDELLVGINIALGAQSLDACSVFDANQDGQVSVDELIAGVNNDLNGCPVAAETPTATPADSPTPTISIPTATPSATATPPPVGASPTATSMATPVAHFCDLPGSVQYTADGVRVVPGGPAGSFDLSFLHLPVGFCAHYFGQVGNARQLRFAPGGELFVASPTMVSTGGGGGGKAAILVLPDDNHDGTADATLTFLGDLPATQGMLFANGFFYYQNSTAIMRVPYAAGDRTPSGPSEQVADITIYHSILHWPKAMDIADDGTIYVANGGDQAEQCDPTHPFHGGILKLDGSPGGTPVVKGFRNPISLRCARGHNRCFAVELARDYSAGEGGREKLAPIREGDDWGFPCCATKDLPYPDIRPVPDCSGVVSEDSSFVISETPFDLDFETGKWPAPWDNRVYVPLHGAAGTWKGARLVAVAMDPATGELLPGSDLPGTPNGALMDFATGWDDDSFEHGRPANVAFAPDGRLFLGNDTTGDIIWLAPLGL